MSFSSNGAEMGGRPLVRVKDVKKHFRLSGGWLGGKKYVYAVDGVSFDVAEGEVFGLVGESGCGKTTLSCLILKLIDVTGGAVQFDGRDLSQLKGSDLRQLRQQMQLVFQNPIGSLSPRQRVLDIVAEPLKTHRHMSKEARRANVIDLLEQVGLGEQRSGSLSPRNVRRAVPARRHCPRPGPETEAAHFRRTYFRPGRLRAGANLKPVR